MPAKPFEADLNSGAGKKALVKTLGMVFLIALITFTIGFVGYLKHKTFKTIIIAQAQEQLLTLSRTAAQNIEEFLDSVQKDLRIVAQIPEIQQIAQERLQDNPAREKQRHLFKQIFQSLDSRVNAFYLMDTAGVILDRYPYKAERIGTNYSDKPGVAWVKRRHESYTSPLFMTGSGQPGFSVLYPVFQDSTFVGLIRALIHIDKLYTYFIQPIDIGDGGYMVLTGPDGTIYYHPNHQFIGQNLQFLSHRQSTSVSPEVQDLSAILLAEETEDPSRLVQTDSSEQRFMARSYISVNPVASGSAGIKLKRRATAVDIAKNQASIMAAELDARIRTQAQLTNSAYLHTTVNQIMDEYPAVIELSIHGPGPGGRDDIRYVFSTSPNLVGQPSDPEDIYVIQEDRTHLQFVNQQAGRPHAGEAVIDITVPLHTDETEWGLTLIRPAAFIARAINNNLRDTALLVVILILALIGGAIVIAVIRKQKAISDSEAENLRLLAEKNAEIHKQSNFITNLLEALPHPFYVINVSDYSITMANSATGMGGRNNGAKCYTVTHNLDVPCNTKQHRCPLKEIVKTKKPIVLEHIHWRNGNREIVEVHGYPVFDDKGEVAQVIEYSFDISERIAVRKKLEQALAEAKKGERVKSLFLANMSHEIRTPLNSILGFTELIESSVRDQVSPEEKEFFTIVKNSGKRLMQTVHEIMDISQIEAGAYSAKPETFDLCQLIKDLVQESSLMAKNKGLVFHYTCQPETAFIHADNYGIAQAIRNILDNAIKYTEQGSIHVTVQEEEKQVRLTIEDTGVGIAKDYLEKMFDVFSQESEGYTKKYQGIGLGMAIAKRHLDANHVGLKVASVKGEGTTFTLIFQTVQSETQPPVKTRQPEETGPEIQPDQKQNILVVEDDIQSQNLVKFFLKRYYRIFTADSVRTAKTVLAKEAITLVLLDLSLVGNENGLDLVRWMRVTAPWQDTPVIATTAHAFVSDRERCLTAGCTDYLSKPIRREVLIQTIKDNL